MATQVCKYYSYGTCRCRSAFGINIHLLMGCPYETTKNDGYPSPIRQKRYCEHYKPFKEE